MSQISWSALKFVKSRILDGTDGFNYWIKQAAQDVVADYGVKEFTLIEGVNLFIGPATPQELELMTDTKFPVCKIYTKRASSQSLVTPSMFSGPIAVGVTFLIASNVDGPNILEPMGCMIEDAMMETFNKETYYGRTGTTGMTYNNEIDGVRGAPVFSGQVWRQMIEFPIIHRVLTNGR